MTDEIRREVLGVYADVDRAVAAAGPRCDASGKCCRFEEYGHVLFISGFEAEILLEAAPKYDQPVSTAGCPFQVDGLCTERSSRPLGCRIYFCDPAYEETGNRITESALAALKAIADRHEVGWRYARLHDFLNAAPVAHLADTMIETDAPVTGRISLPLA